MLSMTSREFNQDTSAAKRAALQQPVVITDRGTPAHVLLSYEAYAKLISQQNIIDALACPAAAEIDFDPPKLQSNIFRPAEFE